MGTLKQAQPAWVRVQNNKDYGRLSKAEKADTRNLFRQQVLSQTDEFKAAKDVNRKRELERQVFGFDHVSQVQKEAQQKEKVQKSVRPNKPFTAGVQRTSQSQEIQAMTGIKPDEVAETGEYATVSTPLGIPISGQALLEEGVASFTQGLDVAATIGCAIGGKIASKLIPTAVGRAEKAIVDEALSRAAKADIPIGEKAAIEHIKK